MNFDLADSFIHRNNKQRWAEKPHLSSCTCTCPMLLLPWFPSSELSTSGTDGDVDAENAAETKKTQQ